MTRTPSNSPSLPTLGYDHEVARRHSCGCHTRYQSTGYIPLLSKTVSAPLGAPHFDPSLCVRDGIWCKLVSNSSRFWSLDLFHDSVFPQPYGLIELTLSTLPAFSVLSIFQTPLCTISHPVEHLPSPSHSLVWQALRSNRPSRPTYSW